MEAAPSNLPGVIDVAMNTAEMVLESRFGLPRPDWVSADHYTGP